MERVATAPRTEMFQHYRSLVESMPVGIFMGRDGECLFLNEHCARLVGLPREQCLGWNWSQTLHPDDRGAFMQERMETLSRGEIFEREYRFLHADGRTVWVWGRSIPLKSFSGAGFDYVGTLIDITDKKMAEQALRNSESTYRSVVSALTEGILFVNAAGLILDANQSAERIFGTAREKLVGINCLASQIKLVRLDGSGFPDSEHPVKQTLLTGDPSHDVVVGIHRERGDLLWLSINCQPLFRNGEPTPYAVVVSFTNITHWVRQDALRSGMVKALELIAIRKPVTETLRLLVDLVAHDQGLIATAYGVDEARQNLIALETSQLPPQLGQAFKIVPIQAGFGSCGAAAYSKTPMLADNLLTHPNWHPLQELLQNYEVRACWSYPMIATDGHVLGTFAFYSRQPGLPTREQVELFEAITYLAGLALEREQAENERLVMEQQFLQAQKFESLGVLTGGIAHDFNNLLTAILGAAGLVREGLPKQARQQTWVDQIENAALQASALARQMLIYAGQSAPAHEVVDLNRLIQSMKHLLELSIHKKCSLSCALEDNLPPLSADPSQLRQILMNLAINASDAYQQKMGHITVRTSQVQRTDLLLTRAVYQPESLSDSYVCLSVEDQGSGMTAETRSRIFDPFFTTKQLGQGTGLGLATVLGIVRSHGGFVNVYSELGRGSTFKVYLPAQDGGDEAGEAGLGAREKLPRGKGELVLVVDDETSILEITKQTLEAFGYRVITSEDGAQAIGQFALVRDQVGVVLTDMMMPVMDGPALISALHHIDPRVRIIAASGLDANENVARAASLGVKHFLPKPYSASTLLDALHRVLAEPGPRPPP